MAAADQDHCRTDFAAVRDAIRELHSYELPECVALSIEDGSPDISVLAGRFGEKPFVLNTLDEARSHSGTLPRKFNRQ